MKKLYLAIIFIIFSSLLATVLAVLAYNKSQGNSSSNVDELAAQVDSLVIRTTDLENSMTTTITAEPSTTNEGASTVATKEVPKEEVKEVKEVKEEAPKVENKTETKAETNAVTNASAKTVTGSSVNMRSEPKTSASLITTLSNGTQVTSDGQTSKDSGITFVKVTYNGTTGWISQDYLK